MPRAGTVQPSITGLRSVRVLAGLPDDALQALAGQCAWRRHAPGQRIIARDSDSRDVYVIVSGSVRVTAFSASGRQVTFRDIPAGELFGELAAIDGRARAADVVAIDDVLVASLAPAAFRQLLREHPTVNDRIMERLVASIRELTERVFDLSTLGVQNRVHAEILRLARLAGVSDNQARIDPAPRHADVASQISTYREQVARELSAMAKQGLAIRSGKALSIPDVGKLERLVAEVRQSG